MVLPEHLERKEQVIEPDVDTTDLAYSPAKLTVKVIVRPKYVATTDQDPTEPTVVQIAPMPKLCHVHFGVYPFHQLRWTKGTCHYSRAKG